MDKSRLKNLYYVISLDACIQLESGLSTTMRSCPLKLRGVFLSLAILESGEGDGTPLQYSCLENPWMEEPGRLQSLVSLRVGDD